MKKTVNYATKFSFFEKSRDVVFFSSIKIECKHIFVRVWLSSMHLYKGILLNIIIFTSIFC